jgi:hypothetical protein
MSGSGTPVSASRRICETAMKPITLFILLAMVATSVVEFAGLGVFAANRRYWDAIERYRRQNRYAFAGHAELDCLYREANGPGAGFGQGLVHGVLGMPRVMLFFGMVASNNLARTRLYLSPDPAFSPHNRGNSYLAGFILGTLLFVALLARSLPFPRYGGDPEGGEAEAATPAADDSGGETPAGGSPATG